MGKMIQQAPQSVFPARKRIGEYPAPSRIVRTASRHPPLPWKRLCIGCIQGWCQRWTMHSMALSQNIPLSGIKRAKILRYSSSLCSSAKQHTPLTVRTFPFQRFVRRKLTWDNCRTPKPIQSQATCTGPISISKRRLKCRASRKVPCTTAESLKSSRLIDAIMQACPKCLDSSR